MNAGPPSLQLPSSKETGEILFLFPKANFKLMVLHISKIPRLVGPDFKFRVTMSV